jgi:type I restriction enzyme, S subunit
MKAGWEVKSFEDCIKKVTYSNKIQRKDFLTEGAYPVISQEEDFINGYWNIEADKFKVEKPVIVFGDHTKVLKYVDFDFVLGADGVKILPPLDFLEPKFFYYQLQTANLEALGYARHYKLLKALNIVFPTLIEQQRIVAILDQAFEGIAKARANTEQNLQNARALFESHLQSIFTQRGEGWTKKRFDQVCVLQRGFDLPTQSRTQGKYPLVTSNGITDTHNQAKVKGPGVVTGRSGSIGNVFFIEEDFWPLNTALYIKDFHGNDPKFIHIFLQYFDLKRYASGAGVPTLNRNFVHSEIVITPDSVNEQKTIVKKVQSLLENTQRLEAFYQRKIACLDELKKSLLQQAFAGEL